MDPKLSQLLDEFDLGFARMQRTITAVRAHFDDGKGKSMGDMTDDEFQHLEDRLEKKK